MDIKEQINKVVEEISKNPNIKDDIVMKIVDGIKAKLSIDNVSNLADSLKGIFK